MIDLALFPRGMLIGLSVAAPVGPMALLCLRRTISGGKWLGFASGAGIACADGLFAAVAAFGLTSISSLLIRHQDWVRLLGGCFLVYLGVTIARNRAPSNALVLAPVSGGQYAVAFGSMIGLTLTNPATILSFAAIFAGYGVAGSLNDAGAAALLVLGVCAGSCGWWLLFATVADRLRSRVTSGLLTTVNRVTGVILTGFGCVAIVSSIA